MKKLRCVFTAESRAFTKGEEYELRDLPRGIVGNDGSREEPWKLDGLEVKTDMGVIARFEEVA